MACEKSYQTATCANSEYDHITNKLLFNAGNNVWVRYLSLSTDPSDDPTDPTMEVYTDKGLFYGTLDLPSNIVVVTDSLDTDEMSSLMLGVSAAVFVGNGRAANMLDEKGIRLRNRAYQIPFIKPLYDASGQSEDVTTQMAMISSALSDYEALSDEAAALAVIGPASLAKNMIARVIQIHNTYAPAFKSMLVN